MSNAPVFDTVRPWLDGQGFTPARIAALDAACEALKRGEDAPIVVEGRAAWVPLAAKIIKEFEGCRLEAYPDPGSGGDPWTIGFGSTGPDIKRGTVWTQEQADARFLADLTKFGAKVTDLLHGAPTTPHQMASLVSLSYNIGLGNLASSTLLKLHKSGDYDLAETQFARWNKAAGRVMAGLTRRRAAEAALYRGAP